MTTTGGDQHGAGPHQGQPVLHAGAPLAAAQGALVLLHGRGAPAADMLELATTQLAHPGIAYLAPQAAGWTWYPYSFLAPLARNEPYFSSALAFLDMVVQQVTAAGVPPGRVVLAGFSQGACLTSEYVARHARRYGGVIAWSGGLIGPDSLPRDYPGSLDGTPVFLGCSDVDPHIPRARVDLTAQVFERMGGAVSERIYPGMGHTVNDDELEWARELLVGVTTQQ